MVSSAGSHLGFAVDCGAAEACAANMTAAIAAPAAIAAVLTLKVVIMSIKGIRFSLRIVRGPLAPNA